MSIHNVKMKKTGFTEVLEGRENALICCNDQEFKLGDLLVIEEVDEGGYTGRYVKTEIVWIAPGEENEVHLGIKFRLEKGARC